MEDLQIVESATSNPVPAAAPGGGLAQLDGGTATAEQLAPLAFAGYAHFTAMQVRGGRVKGLDLHLRRLQETSLAMFANALPADHVRSHLRQALDASPADCSLTATVYSSAGEFSAADGAVPKLLMRTAPPAVPPAGPLALAAVVHQRTLARHKHVGEVAKTWYLREAVRRGFDDAVFIDATGRVAEATIWNLAFWDGSTVVWPLADVLPGVTMGIVKRQLERMGVPQREQELALPDVAMFAGAVVMNSWTPGVPVARVEGMKIPIAKDFVDLLLQAHSAEPLHAP